MCCHKYQKHSTVYIHDLGACARELALMNNTCCFDHAYELVDPAWWHWIERQIVQYGVFFAAVYSGLSILCGDGGYGYDAARDTKRRRDIVLHVRFILRRPSTFIGAHWRLITEAENETTLSQELNFVKYHMKRTTVMWVVHSLLPLCYSIGLGLLEPELHLVSLCTSAKVYETIPIACIYDMNFQNNQSTYLVWICNLHCMTSH